MALVTSVVATGGLAETLVETFGPFLIPVGLFLAGMVGYAVLRWLSGTSPENRGADDEP